MLEFLQRFKSAAQRCKRPVLPPPEATLPFVPTLARFAMAVAHALAMLGRTEVCSKGSAAGRPSCMSCVQCPPAGRGDRQSGFAGHARGGARGLRTEG